MSGAVNQMVQSTGCGYQTEAGEWILRWWVEDQSKPVVTVFLTFPVWLTPGQAGSFVLQRFVVQWDPNEAVQGDESRWSAGQGTCGVEIWENRVTTEGGRYDVRISGVCSGPVPATMGPLGGTVDVAPFHGTFWMPP